MKLYVTYGLLITLASVIFTMTLFMLGYHSENVAMGQKIGWLGIIISIVGLALGMREYRNEAGQGAMSYGRGLGTGLLITLWTALFTSIFNVIYFKFINPGFSEAMVQFQLAEMEAKGMPANTIDQAEGMIRMFMSTPMMVIMGAFMMVFSGLIISLVLAAIFKAKPSADAPPVQG